MHVDDAVEPGQLYHRLNNQLNIVLAQTELLESRLTDQQHKARAAQIISSLLEAMTTARELRAHLSASSGVTRLA